MQIVDVEVDDVELVGPQLNFARLAEAYGETGMRIESKLAAIAASAGLSMLEVHRALHQLFDRKLANLEDDVLLIPDCEALSGFLEPA